MIIKCKNCGYRLRMMSYEFYFFNKCPICFKRELEEEQIPNSKEYKGYWEYQAIESMIQEIKRFGAKYVIKNIETYTTKIRAINRLRYFKALENMKKEKGLIKTLIDKIKEFIALSKYKKENLKEINKRINYIRNKL